MESIGSDEAKLIVIQYVILTIVEYLYPANPRVFGTGLSHPNQDSKRTLYFATKCEKGSSFGLGFKATRSWKYPVGSKIDPQVEESSPSSARLPSRIMLVDARNV
jgi:hypothetical protein